MVNFVLASQERFGYEGRLNGYSSVAQSVEQLTVNQRVTGSSPVRGAIEIFGFYAIVTLPSFTFTLSVYLRICRNGRMSHKRTHHATIIRHSRLRHVIAYRDGHPHAANDETRDPVMAALYDEFRACLVR